MARTNTSMKLKVKVINSCELNPSKATQPHQRSPGEPPHHIGTIHQQGKTKNQAKQVEWEEKKKTNATSERDIKAKGYLSERSSPPLAGFPSLSHFFLLSQTSSWLFEFLMPAVLCRCKSFQKIIHQFVQVIKRV